MEHIDHILGRKFFVFVHFVSAFLRSDLGDLGDLEWILVFDFKIYITMSNAVYKFLQTIIFTPEKADCASKLRKVSVIFHSHFSMNISV